jgi:hypothetical protein
MVAASATTLSLTLRLNRQDYVAMPDEWKPPLMIDEVGGGAHDPDREVHRPDWRSGGRRGREAPGNLVSPPNTAATCASLRKTRSR